MLIKICPELSHHYTLVHTGGVHEQIGINGLDNIGGKQEDILFLKLKSRKGLSFSSRGCLVTYRRILFAISTATDIYKQENTTKIIHEL